MEFNFNPMLKLEDINTQKQKLYEDRIAINAQLEQLDVERFDVIKKIENINKNPQIGLINAPVDIVLHTMKMMERDDVIDLCLTNTRFWRIYNDNNMNAYFMHQLCPWIDIIYSSVFFRSELEEYEKDYYSESDEHHYSFDKGTYYLGDSNILDPYIYEDIVKGRFDIKSGLYDIHYTKRGQFLLLELDNSETPTCLVSKSLYSGTDAQKIKAQSIDVTVISNSTDETITINVLQHNGKRALIEISP